jgi:AcrR family transcriptional regulator
MPTPLLTRDALLSRLCDTFRRHGYEGASMARIAAATGLGKASLYHYFPEGKQQMAAAVLDWDIAWFEANIFAPLRAVHPPRQRIVSMLETLGAHYEKGQCACLTAIFAMTAERDLFEAALQDFHQRWQDALTQTLTDSGLARDIARRRAYDALERIQGALVLARGMKDEHLFANMAHVLPDQLLAGAGRSTVWTTRLPSIPARPAITRAG